MKIKVILIGIAILVFGIILYVISTRSQIASLPKDVIAIEQEFTVSYLIKGNNGYVLFDTGYEHDYPVFLEVITKNNIKIDEIKYVILSHHHDDHVGYINELVSSNKNIKVIMNKYTTSLISKGMNNTNNGGGIVNPLIYALYRFKQFIKPSWKFQFTPYVKRTNDIEVNTEIFDLPSEVGINGKLMLTPGHSSDSMSLIYDDKYLFCGDLAAYFLNWAGAKHLTLFNENVEEVYKSWQRVLDMQVKIILPAHGKPFYSSSLEKNMNKYNNKTIVNKF